MDDYPQIAAHFQNTLDVIMSSVDEIAEPLSLAASVITAALLEDRKLLVCGEGPDAALARLLAGNLLGYTADERPALPAMALDGGLDDPGDTANSGVARQVSALGQPADILFCIASGVPGTGLARAVQSARQRQLGVILLSGAELGEVRPVLLGDDIRITVPSVERDVVVELSTMAINTLSELIELHVFGFER